jgi:hypothetical protein
LSATSTSEGISNEKALCLVRGGSRSSSSASMTAKVSALWHTELMVVEYGFDTIVHVKLMPSSLVSFVVQTDRLASMNINPSCLENSLVVACTLSSDCKHIVTTVTMKSKKKRNGHNKSVVLSEVVTNLGHGEEKGDMDMDMDKQRQSVHLRLRVVYRRMASVQLKDLCQVYLQSSYSTNMNNSNTTTNDMGSIQWVPTKDEGPPIVEFPLELRNEMVLSPTANGGGAWVGLVGRKDELISFNNRNDQSDGNTSVGGILLYGWAFDAKQKHVYNRHVATSSSQPGQPQQQERRRDVGCCLEGSYRVAWPIHLIVTQNALSQYNAVFQFLFSVGRISSLLRGAWALLMASKSQTKSLMHASRLRSRMAFLVDTLQYYFHVDVIAAQWHCLNEILEETKTTHDFEKVQTGHAKFLASISRQCLLHVRTVRDALDQVLETCTALCNCIGEHSNELDEEDEQLQQIDATFTRCSSYLFLVLSGISDKLLLRLDFNDYFSKAANELGGAVSVSVP